MNPIAWLSVAIATGAGAALTAVWSAASRRRLIARHQAALDEERALTRQAARRQMLQLAVTRLLASDELTVQTATADLLASICSTFGWAGGELWLRGPGGLRRTAWHLPGGDEAILPRLGSVEEVVARHGGVWRLEIPGSTSIACAFPITLGCELEGVMVFEAPCDRLPEHETLTTLADAGERLGAFYDRLRLDESLVLLRRAVETMRIGITISDMNGRIIYTNRAEAAMHGYEVEELIGQSVKVFAPPELWRSFSEWGATAWTRESMNVRKDGSVFPVRLLSDVVLDAKGKPIAIVTGCEDDTERKAVEEEIRNSREQLRALSMRLLSIQDDERTWIAREIHDALGQSLTALKGDLIWLAQRLGGDRDETRSKAMGMTSAIDGIIGIVRRISTELRPMLLDDLGLIAAVELEAERFQERTGIMVDVRVGDRDLDLDRLQTNMIFRIIQEAMTNVARHAQAGSIAISVQPEARELLLEIADDGRGISDREIADRNSIGLAGIRERALLLGGHAEIHGTPGAGTVVRVHIPVAARVPSA